MLTGKPWLPFNLDEIEKVPDEVGIFEFGDGHMDSVYIGSSGVEGLRTRLMHFRKDRPDPGIAAGAQYFRCEAVPNNTAWHMRMLEAYQLAHNGRLPAYNHHVYSEDVGGMLHCVDTDKPIGQVIEDFAQAIVDRGLACREVDQKDEAEYRVFKVVDPDDPDAGTDRSPSALPGLVTLIQQEGLVRLRMVRPTLLLDVFHQQDVMSIAKRIEETAVACMDEAAE